MARLDLYYWGQEITRRDGSTFVADLYNVKLDHEIEMQTREDYERDRGLDLIEVA